MRACLQIQKQKQKFLPRQPLPYNVNSVCVGFFSIPVWAHACACAGQRLKSGVFLYRFPFYPSNQGLSYSIQSLPYGYTGWPVILGNLPVSAISITPPPPQHWCYRCMLPRKPFHMCEGGQTQVLTLVWQALSRSSHLSWLAEIIRLSQLRIV